MRRTSEGFVLPEEVPEIRRRERTNRIRLVVIAFAAGVAVGAFIGRALYLHAGSTSTACPRTTFNSQTNTGR